MLIERLMVLGTVTADGQLIVIANVRRQLSSAILSMSLLLAEGHLDLLR